MPFRVSSGAFRRCLSIVSHAHHTLFKNVVGSTCLQHGCVRSLVNVLYDVLYYLTTFCEGLKIQKKSVCTFTD